MLPNKVKLLSDEDIELKSVGLVLNGKDIKLKGNFIEVIGGIYDPKIFGCKEVCKCGTSRAMNANIKCKICGIIAYTLENYAKVIAHYSLNTPYIPQILYLRAVDYLIENFSIDFGSNPSYDKFLQILWGLEFKDGACTSIDTHSNIVYCGTHGLKKIAPDLVRNNIVITNPEFRKYSIFYIKKELKLALPRLSMIYKAIIKSNEIMNLIVSDFIECKNSFNVIDICALEYTFNKLVNKGIMENSLVASSKQQFFRTNTSIRYSESFRANIIPSSNLKIDEIYVPKSLMYHSLQKEILLCLQQGGNSELSAVNEYLNPSKETLLMFEGLVDDVRVLFKRDPVLHEFNLMSFKPKLWDNITIGVPPLIDRMFNADHDGDQMGVFIQNIKTSPNIDQMSPKNTRFYKKSFDPLYIPEDDMLFGLYLATTYNKDQKSLNLSRQELDVKFSEGSLLANQHVLNNTTYGVLVLNDICGVDLNTILSLPITSNNIKELIMYILKQDDFIERLHKLQIFGFEVSARFGIPALPLNSMVGFDDFSDIVNDDIHISIKNEKIFNKMESIIKKNINKDHRDFLLAMDGAGRVKTQSLIEIYGLTYDKFGNLYEGDMMKGLGTKSLIDRVINNREVLAMKKLLVPASGYITRQLEISNLYWIYKQNSVSNDTYGILLPNHLAIGRFDLLGNKIEDTYKEKYIRVKSTATSNCEIVSPNELNLNNYLDLKDDSNIGVSFSQSTSEFITQGALGLKHGGSSEVWDSNKVVSLSKGTITNITDNYIQVDNYRYILNNSSILDPLLSIGMVVDEDQVLIHSTKILSISVNLQNLLALLGLKGAGTFTPSKNTGITLSPFEGILHYITKIVKGKEVKGLTIGSEFIPLIEDELYFYPDGYYVNKFYLLCTGVLNLKFFHDLVNQDYGITYWAMNRGFYHIFKKEVNTELLEIIFKGIKDHNFSVHTANKESLHIISKMGYGWASQALTSIFKDTDDFELGSNDQLKTLIFGTKSV